MGEENEVEKPSTREAGETAAAMDKVRFAGPFVFDTLRVGTCTTNLTFYCGPGVGSCSGS